jgi:RNA polymerase sigma factor (sigma-70 family)
MSGDSKWDMLVSPGMDRETNYSPFEKTDGVGVSYFKEISRIPLLTNARGLELARKIRVGEKRLKNLIGKFLRESGSAAHQPFDGKSLQEIMVFLEQMAENDGAGWKNTFKKVIQVEAEVRKAKYEMINSNLRLVVSIAKAYVSRGLPFLDLIQEGNLGLIKAVSKYDFTKGYKFSTYASWWIRQAILRAISDKSRSIRIPAHLLESRNKLVKAVKVLTKELERDPSPKEIAKKTGLPIKTVNKVLGLVIEPLSLETPMGNEDGRLQDLIPDEDSEWAPENLIKDLDLSKQAQKLLSTLTPREGKILRMRFGIGEKTDYTLKEVGKQFGISRERVRQIQEKALRKVCWRLNLSLHEEVDTKGGDGKLDISGSEWATPIDQRQKLLRAIGHLNDL